ncbi:hypothetical protein QE152_g7986 [Popillia japonica]|uniref:Uncharacterized protein n=1 Tax=Popillia japonica TaxID=7064 RepID=A0AAW1M665_POPJA
MVFVSISFALKKKEKYPTGKRAHRRKREYREVTSQNTIVGVTVVKGADKHDIFLIDTSKSAELLLTYQLSSCNTPGGRLVTLVVESLWTTAANSCLAYHEITAKKINIIDFRKAMAKELKKIIIDFRKAKFCGASKLFVVKYTLKGNERR